MGAAGSFFQYGGVVLASFLTVLMALILCYAKHKNRQADRIQRNQTVQAQTVEPVEPLIIAPIYEVMVSNVQHPDGHMEYCYTYV